jgi:hypothetical protein
MSDKIKVIDDKGAPVSYFAVLEYNEIQNLEGKILTMLDACISEPRQNKAIKDMFRRILWIDWANNLSNLMLDLPSGIPDTVN